MVRMSRIVSVACVLLASVLILAAALPRAQGSDITSFIVTLHSCDAGGNSKTVFGPGEYVYACGTGFDPGEIITLRIIPDDKPYLAANSVCNVTAEANSEGHLVNVKLCTLPPGEYDLWADRNGNGWVDMGMPKPEPVAGLGCPRGFLVVPEYLLGTIAGLAGCFGAFGVFRLSRRKTT